MDRKCVKIANKMVGDDYPCFIIAEIGINHNGSVDLAKKMIDIAVTTGCDAVKFQKRTVDIVYTREELAKERHSVFGNTNGDLIRGLEFGEEEAWNFMVCFLLGHTINRFYGKIQCSVL